jgi:anion transporter
MVSKKIFGILLAVILPLTIMFYPADVGTTARLALALSLFTVVLWTFEPVPIEYSSLLLLLLFPLLGVLPFETAFAAFSGKALWLVFAGMGLSLCITDTPLGDRMARAVLARITCLRKLILSIHVLGVVSALLIPSGVVRILILMPLLIGLLKALGEKPGSRVSAALVMSLMCSTYYGGTGVLTASVPNMVVFGIMESRGISIYWGEWAGYMLPVIGICRTLFAYLLIRVLLPVKSGPVKLPTDLPDGPKAFTIEEKKTIGILILGVVLWSSDALHGIHPAYIGLGLVLLAFLPGVGPLHPDRLRKINFPLLIYVAAAFAMGYAIEHAQLSTILASRLTEWLDLSGISPPFRVGALTYLLLPFNFLADTAAIAAVMGPILLDYAAQMGLPPLPAALSIAIGSSLVFFPYQSAPFVLAYSFRYVRMGQFILMMTLMSVLTLLILVPLNLLYWRLIGLL